MQDCNYLANLLDRSSRDNVAWPYISSKRSSVSVSSARQMPAAAIRHLSSKAQATLMPKAALPCARSELLREAQDGP